MLNTCWAFTHAKRLVQRPYKRTPYLHANLIVVWAGEFHPGPNPKPDVQVSKHPAFQLFLDYGNASALGRMPPQSIAAGVSGPSDSELVPRID